MDLVNLESTEEPHRNNSMNDSNDSKNSLSSRQISNRQSGTDENFNQETGAPHESHGEFNGSNNNGDSFSSDGDDEHGEEPISPAESPGSTKSSNSDSDSSAVLSNSQPAPSNATHDLKSFENDINRLIEDIEAKIIECQNTRHSRLLLDTNIVQNEYENTQLLLHETAQDRLPVESNNHKYDFDYLKINKQKVQYDSSMVTAGKNTITTMDPKSTISKTQNDSTTKTFNKDIAGLELISSQNSFELSSNSTNGSIDSSTPEHLGLKFPNISKFNISFEKFQAEWLESTPSFSSIFQDTQTEIFSTNIDPKMLTLQNDLNYSTNSSMWSFEPTNTDQIDFEISGSPKYLENDLGIGKKLRKAILGDSVIFQQQLENFSEPAAKKGRHLKIDKSDIIDSQSSAFLFSQDKRPKNCDDGILLGLIEDDGKLSSVIDSETFESNFDPDSVDSNIPKPSEQKSRLENNNLSLDFPDLHSQCLSKQEHKLIDLNREHPPSQSNTHLSESLGTKANITNYEHNDTKTLDSVTQEKNSQFSSEFLKKDSHSLGSSYDEIIDYYDSEPLCSSSNNSAENQMVISINLNNEKPKNGSAIDLLKDGNYSTPKLKRLDPDTQLENSSNQAISACGSKNWQSSSFFLSEKEQCSNTSTHNISIDLQNGLNNFYQPIKTANEETPCVHFGENRPKKHLDSINKLRDKGKGNLKRKLAPSTNDQKGIKNDKETAEPTNTPSVGFTKKETKSILEIENSRLGNPQSVKFEINNGKPAEDAGSFQLKGQVNRLFSKVFATDSGYGFFGNNLVAGKDFFEKDGKTVEFFGLRKKISFSGKPRAHSFSSPLNPSKNNVPLKQFTFQPLKPGDNVKIIQETVLDIDDESPLKTEKKKQEISRFMKVGEKDEILNNDVRLKAKSSFELKRNSPSSTQKAGNKSFEISQPNTCTFLLHGSQSLKKTNEHQKLKQKRRHTVSHHGVVMKTNLHSLTVSSKEHQTYSFCEVEKKSDKEFNSIEEQDKVLGSDFTDFKNDLKTETSFQEGEKHLSNREYDSNDFDTTTLDGYTLQKVFSESDLVFTEKYEKRNRIRSFSFSSEISSELQSISSKQVPGPRAYSSEIMEERIEANHFHRLVPADFFINADTRSQFIETGPEKTNSVFKNNGLRHTNSTGSIFHKLGRYTLNVKYLQRVGTKGFNQSIQSPDSYNNSTKYSRKIKQLGKRLKSIGVREPFNNNVSKQTANKTARDVTRDLWVLFFGSPSSSRIKEAIEKLFDVFKKDNLTPEQNEGVLEALSIFGVHTPDSSHFYGNRNTQSFTDVSSAKKFNTSKVQHYDNLTTESKDDLLSLLNQKKPKEAVSQIISIAHKSRNSDIITGKRLSDLSRNISSIQQDKDKNSIDDQIMDLDQINVSKFKAPAFDEDNQDKYTNWSKEDLMYFDAIRDIHKQDPNLTANYFLSHFKERDFKNQKNDTNEKEMGFNKTGINNYSEKQLDQSKSGGSTNTNFTNTHLKSNSIQFNFPPIPKKEIGAIIKKSIRKQMNMRKISEASDNFENHAELNHKPNTHKYNFRQEFDNFTFSKLEISKLFHDYKSLFFLPVTCQIVFQISNDINKLVLEIQKNINKHTIVQLFSTLPWYSQEAIVYLFGEPVNCLCFSLAMKDGSSVEKVVSHFYYPGSSRKQKNSKEHFVDVLDSYGRILSQLEPQMPINRETHDGLNGPISNLKMVNLLENNGNELGENNESYNNVDNSKNSDVKSEVYNSSFPAHDEKNDNESDFEKGIEQTDLADDEEDDTSDYQTRSKYRRHLHKRSIQKSQKKSKNPLQKNTIFSSSLSTNKLQNEFQKFEKIQDITFGDSLITSIENSFDETMATFLHDAFTELDEDSHYTLDPRRNRSAPLNNDNKPYQLKLEPNYGRPATASTASASIPSTHKPILQEHSRKDGHIKNISKQKPTNKKGKGRNYVSSSEESELLSPTSRKISLAENQINELREIVEKLKESKISQPELLSAATIQTKVKTSSVDTKNEEKVVVATISPAEVDKFTINSNLSPQTVTENIGTDDASHSYQAQSSMPNDQVHSVLQKHMQYGSGNVSVDNRPVSLDNTTKVISQIQQDLPNSNVSGFNVNAKTITQNGLGIEVISYPIQLMPTGPINIQGQPDLSVTRRMSGIRRQGTPTNLNLQNVPLKQHVQPLHCSPQVDSPETPETPEVLFTPATHLRTPDTPATPFTPMTKYDPMLKPQQQNMSFQQPLSHVEYSQNTIFTDPTKEDHGNRPTTSESHYSEYYTPELVSNKPYEAENQTIQPTKGSLHFPPENINNSYANAESKMDMSHPISVYEKGTQLHFGTGAQNDDSNFRTLPHNQTSNVQEKFEGYRNEHVFLNSYDAPSHHNLEQTQKNTNIDETERCGTQSIEHSAQFHHKDVSTMNRNPEQEIRRIKETPKEGKAFVFEASANRQENSFEDYESHYSKAGQNFIASEPSQPVQNHTSSFTPTDGNHKTTYIPENPGGPMNQLQSPYQSTNKKQLVHLNFDENNQEKANMRQYQMSQPTINFVSTVLPNSLNSPLKSIKSVTFVDNNNEFSQNKTKMPPSSRKAEIVFEPIDADSFNGSSLAIAVGEKKSNGVLQDISNTVKRRRYSKSRSTSLPVDIEELDSETTNNWTRRFSTPQLELSSTESVINDGEYMSAAYLEYLSKPIKMANAPKLVTVTKNKRMDSQKVQPQQYVAKNMSLHDEMSEEHSKSQRKAGNENSNGDSWKTHIIDNIEYNSSPSLYPPVSETEKDHLKDSIFEKQRQALSEYQETNMKHLNTNDLVQIYCPEDSIVDVRNSPEISMKLSAKRKASLKNHTLKTGITNSATIHNAEQESVYSSSTSQVGDFEEVENRKKFGEMARTEVDGESTDEGFEDFSDKENTQDELEAEMMKNATHAEIQKYFREKRNILETMLRELNKRNAKLVKYLKLQEVIAANNLTQRSDLTPSQLEALISYEKLNQEYEEMATKKNHNQAMKYKTEILKQQKALMKKRQREHLKGYLQLRVNEVRKKCSDFNMDENTELFNKQLKNVEVHTFQSALATPKRATSKSSNATRGRMDNGSVEQMKLPEANSKLSLRLENDTPRRNNSVAKSHQEPNTRNGSPLASQSSVNPKDSDGGSNHEATGEGENPLTESTQNIMGMATPLDDARSMRLARGRWRHLSRRLASRSMSSVGAGNRLSTMFGINGNRNLLSRLSWFNHNNHPDVTIVGNSLVNGDEEDSPMPFPNYEGANPHGLYSTEVESALIARSQSRANTVTEPTIATQEEQPVNDDTESVPKNPEPENANQQVQRQTSLRRENRRISMNANETPAIILPESTATDDAEHNSNNSTTAPSIILPNSQPHTPSPLPSQSSLTINEVNLQHRSSVSGIRRRISSKLSQLTHLTQDATSTTRSGNAIELSSAGDITGDTVDDPVTSNGISGDVFLGGGNNIEAVGTSTGCIGGLRHSIMP